jgi:hypothetical protein
MLAGVLRKPTWISFELYFITSESQGNTTNFCRDDPQAQSAECGMPTLRLAVQGIMVHRGKGLAAFLKAIGSITGYL